ncbi:MAG: phosphatidate cytidylyltransferase [Anaerolineales bacterium]
MKLSSTHWRMISALVLVPIVIGAVIRGEIAFFLLIILVLFQASREYGQMLKRKGYHLSSLLMWAIILTWAVTAHWLDDRWLIPGLTWLLLLSILWILYKYETTPGLSQPIEQWALTVAGSLYLGVGGAHLLRLRAHPDGLWWTLTTLFIVWIADTAAFYFGRAWGKHKIAPTLSPGKSWEGIVAGVGGGILAGVGLTALWPWLVARPTTPTMWQGALLGALLAILTPAGDFFISLIKRQVGVKDTSDLIPGHGGVLDRIDSIVWAGIIAWTFVILS